MNSSFQSHLQPTSGPMISALSLEIQDDSTHPARVLAAQQLLFPASPRSLCDELGLSWQAALRLQEEGWFSFSLEKIHQLDEAQEAELRCLGTLLLAGCDRNMLAVLLGRLPRPYAYDLKRLYYDWCGRRWRSLPDPSLHPETVFTDWLDQLVQSRDIASLVGIVELAQDALARVRRR